MEYNHLQEISIIALRNRLLLLHHISELFCPCIPMFDLEGHLGQTGHGPSVGFDTLRGILISQGKVRRHPVTKIRKHNCCVCWHLISFVCLTLNLLLFCWSRKQLSGRLSKPPWWETDNMDPWWSSTEYRYVRNACICLKISFVPVSSPLCLSVGGWVPDRIQSSTCDVFHKGIFFSALRVLCVCWRS